jgi:hypothetical protein
MSLAKDNGGVLARYGYVNETAGPWAAPQNSFNSEYYVQSTVDGIVQRGCGEYTSWRFGFPDRFLLNEKGLQTKTPARPQRGIGLPCDATPYDYEDDWYNPEEYWSDRPKE